MRPFVFADISGMLWLIFNFHFSYVTIKIYICSSLFIPKEEKKFLKIETNPKNKK